MTPELGWAIGAVVAIYAFVRWGLPALGVGRNGCGGARATKKTASEVMPTEEGIDRWSKTEPFTETTVQIPPDPRN